MGLWRIRITLSDDPHSRALFSEALAGQAATEVSLTLRGNQAAEMTGEAVVDLKHHDDLGTMLAALQAISPQVLVSRAEPPEPRTAVQQPRRVPRLPREPPLPLGWGAR